MKKLLYLVFLGVCFVAFFALTFLSPRQFESRFVIAQETEQAIEHNRVMTLNRPENYDLGVVRTDNMFDAFAYKELVVSDAFLRQLVDERVRLLDGSWEGTYGEYVQQQKSLLARLMARRGAGARGDSALLWQSPEQEKVKIALLKAIDTEVDFETEFLTITFTSQDPFVSTTMAKAIQRNLLTYVENYQQEKMAITLEQLHALSERAKADYLAATDADEKAVKEQIYLSFARQEVIFDAQSMYRPAFVTIAEPSFSYGKVAPKRFKLAFLLTALLACALIVWKKWNLIKAFLLK